MMKVMKLQVLTCTPPKYTWLPAFVRDNRSYLTVAIGCTGGQHRSVYIAERLGAAFGAENQVMVRHRQVRQAENLPV